MRELFESSTSNENKQSERQRGQDKENELVPKKELSQKSA